MRIFRPLRRAGHWLLVMLWRLVLKPSLTLGLIGLMSSIHLSIRIAFVVRFPQYVIILTRRQFNINERRRCSFLLYRARRHKDLSPEQWEELLSFVELGLIRTSDERHWYRVNGFATWHEKIVVI